MKEYLVKGPRGNFLYGKDVIDIDPDILIEIPDCAEMYVKMSHANRFTKKVNGVWMAFGDTNWVPFDTNVDPSINNEVLWRREQEIKMKEYLDKEKGYVLVKDTAKRSEDWIEVPEDAEFLTCLDNNEEEILIFWKEDHKKCLCCNDDWVSGQPPMSNYMDGYDAKIAWRREKTVEYLDPSDCSLKKISNGMPVNFGFIKVPDNAVAYVKQKGVWSGFIFDMNHVGKGKVLWQRHTQPEELPFIDDEPKYKELDQLILENSENIAIPESWKENRNASDIADAALKHIRERAVTYDQADGERSAAKTAKAFNAITGKDITESEIWLMLQLLKDVRQWSRDEYHVDSAEDCIAYAALKAESLEKSNVSHNQGS